MSDTTPQDAADNSAHPRQPGAPAPVPKAAGSLGDRLRALVDWYEQRYNIRLSNYDIARGITTEGGKISHATIAALLNGTNDNPQLRTIFDLAKFFGVDPAFFVTRAPSEPSEEAEDESSAEDRLRRLAQTSPRAARQVALLAALKELGAVSVGARGFLPTDEGRDAMLRILHGLGHLSADGQAAVAGVVEAMQRAHQPPHDPGTN